MGRFQPLALLSAYGTEYIYGVITVCESGGRSNRVINTRQCFENFTFGKPHDRPYLNLETSLYLFLKRTNN